jgi:hypothetical protein
MIVKDTLTPLSRDDASRAFLSAYQQLTGKLPTPAVLALLLAQSAFETGHWKSLHNFNFGNAKAGPGYPLVTQFHCSEVDALGVEHFYDPPDPHCNFRAYDNAAAGALDYLKVLQNRPHWWQGLHTEDPSAFVDALATPPKYFTGNPAVYKRSVVSLFQTFFPLAEVALAVASIRPTTPSQSPAPAPAPVPSSSSASPQSDSSGVRPAPSNSANSASPKPPATAPNPTQTVSTRTVEAPGVLPVKRSVWGRLFGLVLRIARLLFRRPPPGSSA